MDLNKLLRKINSPNEYVVASREVLDENKNTKIQFNMSTVLALKKIRSYEIEYFNKYEENGIACAALQVMLDIAPSKTWGVLGKDIVNLIKYWLDAIRKHLISHSPHWWTFLRLLLKFMKDVRQKDPSIPNQLVEQTAECLLDLASNDKADPFQKHEILHCMNLYCAEANREIRFALRNKLGEYFTKLSLYISSCDHFPCQLSVMETLLRWLVPRHDPILRTNSADKWFPTSLYSREAVDIFLSRPWINFFQDARDFLNIHNKGRGLVFSVICRRLSIGKIVIISGNEKHTSWLDINCNGRCMSILLDPSMLVTCGHNTLKSWETLLITDDNTQIATLDRESQQIIISVTMTHAPQAHPSLIKITNEPSKDIKIVISSKSDLTALDKALDQVFGDKYQLVLNLQAEVNVSPESSTQNTRNYSNSEDDNRFSHPVVVRRGRHSGYIARSRNPWRSPSTASTTSLAQLHDRLAALPTYKYDKEPVSVCARPELSSVTELSETEDRSFQSATTHKLRTYGVCYRGLNKAQNTIPSFDSKKVSRGLSPAVHEDAAPSCLLVATIGSNDESVINNTMERLAQNKDFEPNNIVDLLIKEALRDKSDDQSDSGINTGENKKTDQEDANCDAIENTPRAEDTEIISRKKCTVVSKSSSDESNTEEIDDTQMSYVNTRRRKTIRKKKADESPAKAVETNVYDAEAVEAFFNQHFNENSAGEVIISPTLAKKINETSSESSEHFDEDILDVCKSTAFDVDNNEVIQCLKSIVDKVCKDFDKYTDYVNVEKDISSLFGDDQESTTMERENHNDNKSTNSSLTPQKSRPKRTKSIKLKYKITPKIEISKKKMLQKADKITPIIEEVTRAQTIDEAPKSPVTKTKTNKKSQKKFESKKELKKNEEKQLEITEQHVEEKDNVSENNNTKETNTIKTKPDLINDIVPDIDTPLIRRKRKLYSPKAEVHNEAETHKISETEGDNAESKTPNVKSRKSSTTFYKDIENERKKQIRKSRARKSKVPEPDSPRTLKKNQLFDKLKETVESSEKITLADKTRNIDVYNFSSDSEEEYFKKKKIVAQKRPSLTTVGSSESVILTRHGRVTEKVNYTETISSNDESRNTTLKRTKAVKKYKPRTRKAKVKPVYDIEDERMRQAPPDNLNSSIIVEASIEKTYAELEPVLEKRPQLETIVDIDESVEDSKLKTKSVKKNKRLDLSLKKGKTSKANSIDLTVKDDRTESPLPGLVVEPSTACKDDNNDSVTGTMLQKFKKIYHDGFDACINDTNTTQNLLSDVEKINYSPEINVYMPDEIQTDQSFSRTGRKIEKQEETKTTSFEKKISTIHDNGTHTKLTTKTINISEVTESKSDKSIASQGINAHGDMDEEPPSTNMIEQQVEPRNLELENLEKSLRDYFDHLHKQVTDCDEKDTSRDNLNNKSHDTIKSNRLSENNLSKSAKVEVRRLSEEEINKWTSSNRSVSSKISETSDKHPKHKVSNKFTKEMSPVVSVSRLSSNEMEKWLNSCNNSIHPQTTIRAKVNVEENKGLDILYDAHKWLPSRRNSSSEESEPNNQRETKKTMIKMLFKNNDESTSKVSNSSSNEIMPRSKVKKNEGLSQYDSRTKLNRLFNNIDNLMNTSNHNLKSAKDRKIAPKSNNLDESKGKENESKEVPKRTSVISPIKIGNFLSQSNKRVNNSDEDEYVKRVRNIFSEGERSINTKKKNYLRDRLTENDVVSSPNSTSTKIESSRATKRKSVSVENEVKKPKLVTETVTDSGPSISSVAEWFRRNEPTCSRDETIQVSLVECVHNIAEKLDTTLVDINQNTSKKFIDMFVDIQKQLDEHKERRRAMYRQAASDMLSQIVNMMDEKFSEIDSRSQEMDKMFMEQLRSRASQMVVDDSKQKQAMVQIMKEDVQAVIDFINRNTQ